MPGRAERKDSENTEKEKATEAYGGKLQAAADQADASLICSGLSCQSHLLNTSMGSTHTHTRICESSFQA